MPPGISLPQSPSPSSTPIRSTAMNSTVSPSPPHSHTPPHTLFAAAAMNAGIHNEESRRSSRSGSMRQEVERQRRRSSIRLNLNLNDPSVPAPGEMLVSSPSRIHHDRAPSLGEIHQELEYEQEGQVNRLLNMIRHQQAQIVALQTAQSNHPNSIAVIDDSTPTSEHSLSLPQAALSPQPSHPQVSATIAPPRTRSPLPISSTLSRHSSVADRSPRSSHMGSPLLHATSSAAMSESGDWAPSAPARDESAFYQAETQNLTRENQMLKQRIRELERQLAELNPMSPITHSPIIASRLHAAFPESGSENSTNPTAQ